jgi:hypothetical protein
MADTLNSRSIAEHLCAFARILEAEAARASVLGLRLERDLCREARDVREMADLLWEADTAVSLAPPSACAPDAAPEPHRRGRGEPAHAAPMPALHPHKRSPEKRSASGM